PALHRSAPAHEARAVNGRVQSSNLSLSVTKQQPKRLNSELHSPMIARRTDLLLLPSALLLFSSISALAQGGTTGRIAGTVKDTKGAVIAGAEITVVSRATGEERKVIADTTGNYAVPLLPPG